jgi:hypothetical protein
VERIARSSCGLETTRKGYEPWRRGSCENFNEERSPQPEVHVRSSELARSVAPHVSRNADDEHEMSIAQTRYPFQPSGTTNTWYVVPSSINRSFYFILCHVLHSLEFPRCCRFYFPFDVLRSTQPLHITVKVQVSSNGVLSARVTYRSLQLHHHVRRARSHIMVTRDHHAATIQSATWHRDIFLTLSKQGPSSLPLPFLACLQHSTTMISHRKIL